MKRRNKNHIEVKGNFALLHLSNNGVALIDTSDISLIEDYTWRLDASGYARTTLRTAPGEKHKHIYLHNLIMESRPGYKVAHKSPYKLDNRRSNLVYLTTSQVKLKNPTNNPNGLRYITYRKADNCYTLVKHVDGKQVYGGSSKHIEALLPLQGIWEAERIACINNAQITNTIEDKH